MILPQEYVAPRHPAGGRTPATRSKASFRSYIVDPKTNRVIKSESHLETKLISIMKMRPDVVEVVGQAPMVNYIDPLGKPRKYTFDMLVTFSSGHKVAYAAKPLEKALKQNLKDQIKWISRFIPKNTADAVMILTELDAEGWRFSNAKLLHSALRERTTDEGALEAVRQVATEPTTIRAIVAATGLGARAFRAAVKLIALGELALTSERLITHDATVQPRPVTGSKEACP